MRLAVSLVALLIAGCSTGMSGFRPPLSITYSRDVLCVGDAVDIVVSRTAYDPNSSVNLSLVPAEWATGKSTGQSVSLGETSTRGPDGFTFHVVLSETLTSTDGTTTLALQPGGHYLLQAEYFVAHQRAAAAGWGLTLCDPTPAPTPTASAAVPAPTLTPTMEPLRVELQGPPAVRVATPLHLTAGGSDAASVRWHLESGSALLAPDGATCTVTPTAPGPVRVTATAGAETKQLLLAGIAPEVPQPLASVAGLPGSLYNSGASFFPPGVFIVTSADDWQRLWTSAAAFTGRFFGFVPGSPLPSLPAVDFAQHALVVLADSLYPLEDAPVLSRLSPTLEVVKPLVPRYISHLDFDQFLAIYEVPKIPRDAPVTVTCQDPSACPVPSPSGFWSGGTP